MYHLTPRSQITHSWLCHRVTNPSVVQNVNTNTMFVRGPFVSNKLPADYGCHTDIDQDTNTKSSKDADTSKEAPRIMPSQSRDRQQRPSLPVPLPTELVNPHHNSSRQCPSSNGFYKPNHDWVEYNRKLTLGNFSSIFGLHQLQTGFPVMYSQPPELL